MSRYFGRYGQPTGEFWEKITDWKLGYELNKLNTRGTFMPSYCHTVQAGSKIRIKGKSDSCCGTVTQGWKGTVREYLEDSHGDIIVILEDGTLAWIKDIEVIKK